MRLKPSRVVYLRHHHRVSYLSHIWSARHSLSYLHLYFPDISSAPNLFHRVSPNSIHWRVSLGCRPCRCSNTDRAQHPEWPPAGIYLEHRENRLIYDSIEILYTRSNSELPCPLGWWYWCSHWVIDSKRIHLVASTRDSASYKLCCLFLDSI